MRDPTVIRSSPRSPIRQGPWVRHAGALGGGVHAGLHPGVVPESAAVRAFALVRRRRRPRRADQAPRPSAVAVETVHRRQLLGRHGRGAVQHRRHRHRLGRLHFSARYLCTGSHDRKSPTFEFDNGPIVIEDGVWLCARSTVLRGVTIGANSVVGATIACHARRSAGFIVRPHCRQSSRES